MGLEEWLTGGGLIWLGGVTLVLGGVFLVKYTIDQGLLGPMARVILGLLLGIGAVRVAGAVRDPAGTAARVTAGAMANRDRALTAAVANARQVARNVLQRVGAASPGAAGSDCGASGSTSHSAAYSTTPNPIALLSTKNARTHRGSTRRCTARPPATPPRKAPSLTR